MKYIYGCFATHEGIASNNRGENLGNISQIKLVKKLVNGVEREYSYISADAQRFAARLALQRAEKADLNRTYDADRRLNLWDGEGQHDPEKYVDDDLFGFMQTSSAEISEEEVEDKNGKTRKKSKVTKKGQCHPRKSPIEITPALSTQPWDGEETEVQHNFASAGASQGNNATEGNCAPYASQLHYTRYITNFALNTRQLVIPERARLFLLESIYNMNHVGGSHSRYLFDFSPTSMVLRVTNDPSPRILYCLEDYDRLSDDFKFLVESGDIAASELIIGGKIAKSDDGQWLTQQGALNTLGIRAALEEALNRAEIQEMIAAEPV